MKAILEVKKGESPYKIMRSPWLEDSDGPVLFKILSKKQIDGKIKTAYVVERKGGRKTVLGTTETTEEKFMDAVNAFRETVWQQFPKVNLAIEDVEPINKSTPHSTAQYSAMKNNKWGHFWLIAKKWLRF